VHVPSRGTVLLCGATGLVGRECLHLLVRDPAFERIAVLTRRPLGHGLTSALERDRIHQHLVDFDRLADHAELFGAEQIIWTLGTTMKRAGSKQRFREVDFGYPYTVAQLALERGAQHFLLVSAINASAGSRVFYNRVKGELEDALRALPYRSITIVRPSLLLGEREEPRLGEAIAKRLAFLAPRKYKPVAGRAVAAALIESARADRTGVRIIESPEIEPLAESYLRGRRTA
jgi:uncharacterized protein YbjT (DUF2867 family)